MKEADIRDLAEKAGLLGDWVDADDRPQQVPAGTLQAILNALGYPCGSGAELADSRERLLRESVEELPSLITAVAGAPIVLPSRQSADEAEITLETGGSLRRSLRGAGARRVAIGAIDQIGYHRLKIAERELTIAVAPSRCVTFADIAPGEKIWGLAVQLYALRRAGDGGIGDASALADLAVGAAREGADAVAVSPVHSLFPADLSRVAPYSPSSRLFLNPLHADPSMLFPADRIAAVRGEDASELENAALIDWPAAARAKYALLRRLFDAFAKHELSQSDPPPLARDFRAFVREQGAYLQAHAVFEALHRKWFGVDPSKWHWSNWEPPWRDPDSRAVKGFAETEAREVQFSKFLQWVADRSFAAAQARVREAGMRIGIIADLAVGMDGGGSHAWSRQEDLLLGLSVGAPPDKINGRGQNWGLTAFSPRALVRRGFEPFLATLRASLRHAGGLRIDHAMGLMRLWVIPEGADPRDGAYLRYPLDDLLNLVALESYRHRAVVIGEDLGTVPPEFRRRMAEKGISGMDVLWFERGKDGGFNAPQEWRADSVGMTTTHDLPTVAGWWSGADVDARAACGLVPDLHSERKERARDRAKLWGTFRRAKITYADEPSPERLQKTVDAAIAFVASASSPLSLIPVEDVLGVVEQPNLPGTIDEHPNWRRRFEKPADRMLEAADAKRRLATLRERRN